MNILVNRIDTAGTSSNLTISMSRLALIKHMAFAGQGYAPIPQKLFRMIGMAFHYSQYTRHEDFHNNKFSEPPIALSDPTEKAQFSNLAGKAIADFLSKKLDNAFLTVSYEAAMRIRGHKISGARPDLISYTQNAAFSIEAKGRHQYNAGNMVVHKRQARSGPIPVNFSVACVSYNLFSEVKCNYHDPFNNEVPYDNVSLQALSRNYYRNLQQYLDLENFEIREIQVQQETFYEIHLFPNQDRRIRQSGDLLLLWPFYLLDHFRFCLLLPKEIGTFARDGITQQNTPFILSNEAQLNSGLYIDRDRIGLKVDQI